MEERSARSADGVLNLPMVLRDIVVFPHTMVPFVVGRKPSLAVERALAEDKTLFLATQRNAKVDNPVPDEINSVGTVATIVQHLKLPNGNVKLLVEGGAGGGCWRSRRTGRLLPRGPQAHRAQGGGQPRGPGDDEPDLHPLRALHQVLAGLPYETMLSTVRIADPGRLADTIAAHLPVGVEEKQGLLETISPSTAWRAWPACWRERSRSSGWTRRSTTGSRSRWRRPRRSTTSTRRSRPSSRSWAARTTGSTRSRSSGRRSRPPACPRRPRRRPSRS